MTVLSRLRALLKRRGAPRGAPCPEPARSVVAAVRDHEGSLKRSRLPKAVKRCAEEAELLAKFREMEESIRFEKREYADDEVVGWDSGGEVTVAQLRERYAPKKPSLVLVGLRGMKPYLMTPKQRKAHKEALSAKV